MSKRQESGEYPLPAIFDVLSENYTVVEQTNLLSFLAFYAGQPSGRLALDIGKDGLQVVWTMKEAGI